MAVDRRRLFPKEAAETLPLQARVYCRMQDGRLDDKALRFLITAGVIPAQDDPDAVNAVYAQGW